MYTLRDMDVDVIVEHGPAGCCFMASRPLEDADVRVVTSGMRDNDLVFGGEEPLINTLKQVEEKFHPNTVAVVGTCASMIIGEDMAKSIKRAGIDANVFPVDCHGCMGDNTRGAIRALEAARDAGVIDREECDRQISLMKAATKLEKNVGMAAVDRARRKLGGETLFVANMEPDKGLPRIRNYCAEIAADLASKGVTIDEVVGGLDEYAIVGDRMRQVVDAFHPDLTIILGICHAYPGMGPDDILITDQPRQLANYLAQGCQWAVGEISSHTMVMGAHSIVPLETADTLREMLE